jgi:hypothetical protein
MAESLLSSALRVLHRFFAPLVLAAEDEQLRKQLFLELGWDVDAIADFPQQTLGARLAGIATAYEQIGDLFTQNPDSFEAIQKALSIANQLVNNIRGLGTIFTDVGAVPPANFAEVGNELFSFLQTQYLETHHPLLFRVGAFLTIIEMPTVRPANGQIDAAGNVIRYPHSWPQLNLERLTDLLSDPLGFLKNVYFQGELPQTSDAALQITNRLLPRIGLLLEAMGANVVYGFRPDYGIDFGPIGNQLGTGMLTLTLTPGPHDTFFGLSIALSAPDRGNLGWVFVPSGALSYSRRFRNWHLSLQLTAGVQAFAIGLDGQPTLLVPADAALTTAQARVDLTYAGDDTEHVIEVGNRLGSHLAVRTFAIGAALDLDEQHQRYGLTFTAGKTLLAIQSLFNLGWDKFELSFVTGTSIKFERLQLQLPGLLDFEVEADLPLVFVDSKLQVDPANFQLYKPAISGLLPEDIYLDAACFAIQWRDTNPDSWLNRLVPDFLGQGSAGSTSVTAQVIRGEPIREVRLDWDFLNQPRTFAVPGLIKFETPGDGFFSLLFGAGGRALTRMSFAYTVVGAGTFTLSSNFAWERDADRELHNDATAQLPVNPLFQLKLTAPANGTTLILAEFDLATPTIDGFFMEPEQPLSRLNIADPATLCQPVESVTSFSGDGWRASLTINYGQLQFPFLKQGDDQFIDVFDPRQEGNPDPGETAFTIDDITLDGDNSIIEIPLGLRLKLGDLNITTVFAAEFNWRTLSLSVDHEGGTHLYATKAVLDQDFLGLHWKFIGQLETSGPNKDKYRLFTLVTKNYNYQIQQAAGSKIEIAYDGISSDPIVFQVTDFAITDKGLSLRTTVVDAPVRLNGLDTKFRFDGSGIVIENSQIQSFTIAGSGALPPDLVGDSRASIALQFGRLADGNLTLVSGEAKLEGNNLLHCQGTRFQFSVDALGLKFVNDGKFHLYFTLTGSAQFVLADGDDREGALALLPKIKIDLVEAPLTGDISVIGKHVKFLVELPKPVSFSFLGCFEMELRGIGFEPQAEVFDGDGAMLISGQLKFAQGSGDVIDARIDLHNLHIGLPKPGSFVPRVYFKGLAVSLAISGAFKLNAVVDFIDGEQEKGFTGEGMVDIQGLPSMAGIFGFLRVRRDANSPWLRAWFIYLEVRKVSFVIPVVQIYLREVGLGFGYRYTLASIKAADQEGDIRKLLQELRTLSRTQGDLSKRDRWAVDLEKAGQDPRWTIVLRAMISQTTASAPWTYAEASEKELSCLYLFDAVIAFRSDLTFFMAVRGWFNTNYHDFLTDNQGLRNKPLLSGFVLLAPRQKRFLAHVASNPDGKVGPHPPLPTFVRTAIESAQFSATLLIEPGLLHYEMGWPNMLRWEGKLGPLKVEFQGGFIFRISQTELVTGTSFMARGSIEVEAGFSAGVFGVSVSLFAQMAYGARYIGVLAFKDVTQNSAFYGAIGLELYVRIIIKFWIKLLFVKKTFRLSISVGFTAALEVGIKGNLEPGIRGQGTVSLKAMGRSLRFGVKVGINEEAVDEALARTNKFLNIGLESTEVEALPGLSPQATEPPSVLRAGTLFARRALAREALPATAQAAPVQHILNAPDYTLLVMRHATETYFVLLPAGERWGTGAYEVEPGFLPAPPEQKANVNLALSVAETLTAAALQPGHLTSDLHATNDPNTIVARAGSTVRIGARNEHGQPSEWLLQEPVVAPLAPPGRNMRIVQAENQLDVYITVEVTSDFRLDFRHTPGVAILTLEQYDPFGQDWVPVVDPSTRPHSWRVNWNAAVLGAGDDFSQNPLPGNGEPTGTPAGSVPVTLAEYMRGAFVEGPNGVLADPQAIGEGAAIEDERVHNPTDSAFETAVRGAFEQFRGAPFFKHDPNDAYAQALEDAFSPDTSVYTTTLTAEGTTLSAEQNEHADQVRGLIIHDLVADLQEYVDLLRPTEDNANGAPDTASASFPQTSIAFQMGLIFRLSGPRPAWLDTIGVDAAELPQIHQRLGASATAPNGEQRSVRPFNTPSTSFKTNPPRFDRVRHYTNSTTVGVTWDLVWNNAPASGCTPAQAEPEHHLLHYEIRRRALDTQERDVLFTVKSGEILHRSTEPGAFVERLRPRFQLVDNNFDGLTARGLARLPEQGLSYLYTITPIDLAKNRGRPLTIVATRYPDAPPQVPTNGELTVVYRLERTAMLPEEPAEPSIPTVVEPASVQIQWSEPRLRVDGADAPIRDYELVFRREETLPIGSYGLDSTTQREKVKALPTTNARTRPTDIIVPVDRTDIQPVDVPAGIEGVQHDRVATLPLQRLRDLRILPSAGHPQWRPEAWRVFFRTISSGGVPSALAPVQLKLRVISSRPETPAFQPLPEERRPAELEWLPHPMHLPILPPADQKAMTGDAHFPMPLVTESEIGEQNAAAWRFAGTVNGIAYQLHPAGLRTIRFRWNQGSSNQPNYPLHLSAGYELLELDIDAHTNITLTVPAQLAAVLRPIQDVQMLPADDLILTPGDTLVTTQWEAWYLSTQLRRQIRAAMPGDMPLDGSETPFSPWFSWRESLLVWPAWPAVETGRRNTILHPLLENLIQALQITAQDPPEVEDKYIVDIQGFPPLQPMTFTDFRRATTPAADPYGWGALQRFGLSLTLSLRQDGSSNLVTGAALLGAIQKGLTKALAQSDDPAIAKHLHVELLFQAGESVALQPGTTAAEALLGLVQISLRPVPMQYLRYSVILLKGPANAEIALVINLVAERCTLIEQANVAGRGQQARGKPGEKQIELENAGEPLIHRVVLPLNGATAVLLRSTALFSANVPNTNRIGLRLKLDKALDDAIVAQLVNYPATYVLVNPNQAYLVLETGLTNLAPLQREALRTLLGPDNFAAFDQALLVEFQPPVEFEPTDEYATYFLPPTDQLIATISSASNAEVTKQWLRFKRYAESLNSSGRDTGAPTAEPRIVVPTSASELHDDNLLAQVLSWSQRFFDHCGPVRSLRATNGDSEASFAAQLPGPWLATAYPRAGTPAYATPDEAGRLEYFHLLEDKWAHNYRYYIRPYGRYQQLWRNLYLSPLLWPEDEAVDPASAPPLPQLQAGGLDVVLDRTKPVNMPTILRSGRLDSVGAPGQPATPGKLWEVIIAQHREQALSERNQTVYRQLSFRQIAYTLLRRFAYQETWDQWQKTFQVGFANRVEYPVSNEADLPSRLDPTFYNLDDPSGLSAENLLRFALPRRIDTFQQGALVIQWEALPFYYEHRLLAIAQTSTRVSPVNSVVQRDFEYRAPEPADEPEPGRFLARFMEGTDAEAIRFVEIPLRRLWESLPADVQSRWPDENPTLVTAESTGRRPGLLPDPEVVYQIIEYFQGNIEVQAEIFVDPSSTNNGRARYERRQLGQRQLAEVAALTTPDDGESYQLRVKLQQQDEAGVINWSNEVVLSTLQAPELATPPFTFALLDNCQLVWPGHLSEHTAQDLLALPGDARFKLGLAQLASAAQQVEENGKEPTPISIAIIPPGPEQPRRNLPTGWRYSDFQLSGLPQGATLQLVEAPSPTESPRFVALRWTGLLLAAEQAALLAGLSNWAQIPELEQAVAALFAALAARIVETPYSGDLPTDLPDVVLPQLHLAEGLLRFSGLVKDAAQWQALLDLAADNAPEEAFKGAVQALIQQLQSGPVSVDLDLPKRPVQDALLESLRAQLVIGRSLLRFHGIMSTTTAITAQAAVIHTADKNAVKRLYYLSAYAGLRGRTLRIRTRRGSAQPSAMRDLEPIHLADVVVEPREGEIA